MFVFDVGEDGIPIRPTVVGRCAKARDGISVITDVFKHDVLKGDSIGQRIFTECGQQTTHRPVIIFHCLCDIRHDLDRLQETDSAQAIGGSMGRGLLQSYLVPLSLPAGT